MFWIRCIVCECAMSTSTFWVVPFMQWCYHMRHIPAICTNIPLWFHYFLYIFCLLLMRLWLAWPERWQLLGTVLHSTFIEWNGWILTLAFPWWQHHTDFIGISVIIISYSISIEVDLWYIALVNFVQTSDDQLSVMYRW